VTAPLDGSSDVDAFLATFDHPLKEDIVRLRAARLAAAGSRRPHRASGRTVSLVEQS